MHVRINSATTESTLSPKDVSKAVFLSEFGDRGTLSVTENALDRAARRNVTQAVARRYLVNLRIPPQFSFA
jgi:hypothetical protein